MMITPMKLKEISTDLRIMTKLLVIYQTIQAMSPKYLLGLSVGLIVVGTISSYWYDRPTVHDMNHGYSSSFHSVSVPDRSRRIQLEEVEPIDSYYEFQTSAPKVSQQIRLSFYYMCEPACHQLTLKIKTAVGQAPISLLLAHPILKDLNWFNVVDGGLRLYQKEVSYSSVTELLENPPTGKVLVDDLFIAMYGNDAIPSSLPLSQVNALPDDVEFIITSYDQPRQLGEWRQLEVTMGGLQGIDTANGNMGWILEHDWLAGQSGEMYIARMESEII